MGDDITHSHSVVLYTGSGVVSACLHVQYMDIHDIVIGVDEVFQFGINSETIANAGFMQSRFSINTFICFKEVNYQ